MKSLVLSQTDYLVFPLIAVVMFVAIFLMVLAWVFRPGSKAAHAQRSRLVFGASDSPEHGAGDGHGASNDHSASDDLSRAREDDR